MKSFTRFGSKIITFILRNTLIIILAFSTSFANAEVIEQHAEKIINQNADAINNYFEKLYIEQFITYESYNTYINYAPEPKPLPDDAVYYDLKVSIKELVLDFTVYTNGPFSMSKSIRKEPEFIYLINEEYGVAYEVSDVGYDAINNDKIYIFAHIPDIDYDIYISVDGYKKKKNVISLSRLYLGNMVEESHLPPYWRRYVHLIPLTTEAFVPFFIQVLDKNGKPYVNTRYGFSIEGENPIESATDMNGNFIESFMAPLGTKLHLYLINPFDGKSYKQYDTDIVVEKAGQIFVLVPEKKGIRISTPGEIFHH